MKARGVDAVLKVYFPTPFADCCREFQRATDSKQPPSDFGPNLPHKVLKCIQDSRYIEHDAYFLFDYIMLNVWEWYFVATSTGINGARARTNVITVEATEQRLFSGDNHGDDGIITFYTYRFCLSQEGVKLCSHLFRSLWRCPTSSKGVGQRLGNPRPGAVPSSQLEFRIAHDVRD